MPIKPNGLIRVELNIQDHRSPHWWIVRSAFFTPEEFEQPLITSERVKEKLAEAREALNQIRFADMGS